MVSKSVVSENERDLFDEDAKNCASTVYRGEFSSQPQAANRPSFLREGSPSNPSVSYGPPPSFLTKTPLGTPHEETGELKPVDLTPEAEMPGIKQQNDTIDPVPLSRKALEQPPKQTRQVLEKSKRKTGPSKKIEKPYKRNRGHGVIQRWGYEEVRLSMSKTSIIGLVLGLLLLGALFFVIGFLAAVATLKSEEKHHSLPSTWQAFNTPPQQGQPHNSRGDGKLGRIVGAVGDNLVGYELHKKFGKALGAASSLVPQPLKPFARYGTSSTYATARNAEREVNPFYPHRRMRTPEQQPSGAPQPYESPAMPAGYQQQPAFSQGGQGSYQGYSPMQQQAQPYYQPQQPMMIAPQPQMRPQQSQYPQPQYPQPYPQQMAPQQGYYR